ncbi:fasciclin domain-containing protein [Candidatus Leptofilum sp.]|uniref:fasciclin domain-containing protein n=1 Tax=Candidatus Leptofilum sp. TaxID=3241576 RepID=UPI003B5BD825
MKNLKTLIVILILSLVLVACGASEEESAEPTAEPTAAPVEEAAEEEMDEEEEMGSIVDIAVADGRFTTLVAAVQAAGLAETLSGEGAFTVFAPTDDAFAALPEGTVESLLEDPEGALTDVLQYHVVDGKVKAETVVTLESATTLGGEDVSITVTDGNVFLNETTQVIITDIEASNGVIHVIDAVLLPPSMTAKEEMMDDLPSIAEIAVEDGRFTTLVAALDAAGLVGTLSDEGAFTVFAPTDDAFAALPEGTVESLLEDPAGGLTDILLYHVVDGAVKAESVVTLESATTLQGEDVSIVVKDGSVFLNDTVQVIITDIEASNGVIHVVDAVLLPPSMTAEEEMMDDLPSIAEIAVEDGRFTTLVAALTAADLVGTLSGEGDFTVFAPTDDAFAALPEGTVESLLEDPTGDLTDILLYHVVEGAVAAETVVTLESATTLNGADVTITVTEDGEVFLNDTVQVIITDIQASNGIIHVIDGVLLP